MISSEVQRTLVKSPPELWAELSDPDALSRHLGELGDVRITRTEPESTVEWAAENISGTVSIKPSGWGTKVTLTATRTLAAATDSPDADAEASDTFEHEHASDAVEHEPETQDVEMVHAEPEPIALSAEPSERVEHSSEPERIDEPAVAAEDPVAEIDEPVAEIEEPAVKADEPTVAVEEPVARPEPEPRRRGFFARLFRRERPESTAPTPPEPAPVLAEATSPPEAPAAEAPATETPAAEAPAASPRAAEPESAPALDAESARDTRPALDVELATEPADAAPEADAAPRVEHSALADDEGTEQAQDLAAELAMLEEQTTAVLTDMLDRLGAAHHRPFSRS